MARVILIAIGANLPDYHGRQPLVTCRAAVEAIRDLPSLALIAVSRWYRSTPLLSAGQDPTAHPDYVNGIVRLQGDPDPAWLLARLNAIEAQAGRVRGARNAPRTLDLDIIAIGDQIRDAPDPVLPHPRAHLRHFVLHPIADVAPDWVHPRYHQSVGTLIESLPAQGIAAMPGFAGWPSARAGLRPAPARAAP